METQMKQRVVGILVLLLLVVAIASLLLYGLKQNEKVLDPTLQQGQIIEAASDKEVQLSIPSDNKPDQAQPENNPAVQISQTPRDIIKNTTQEHSPVVSNNFGQVDANADAGTVNKTVTDKKDGQNLKQLASKQISQDEKSPIVEKGLPTVSVANPDSKSTVQASLNVDKNMVTAKTPAVSQANSGAGNVQETPTASDMLANDAEKSVTQPTAKPQNDISASSDENDQTSPENTTKIASIDKTKKKQVMVNKTVSKPKATAVKTIKISKIAKQAKRPAGKIKPINSVSVISHGWSVKFGSFVSPPNAAGLISKLRAKGYHTYTSLVVTETQGVLTQVFVGPVATQAQAMQILKATQKNLHITGTIMQIAPKAKNKVKIKIKPANKPVKIVKKNRSHNI